MSQRIEQYKQQLSELCRKHNIWLNAGTLPEPYNQHKYYAASHLFNNQGNIVASYNKIHLFDVEVDDQTGSYRELILLKPAMRLWLLIRPLVKLV